jgi:hypothetical protein
MSEKTITLPSGAVAVIRQGKGRDVRQAQKMSDGDTSLYMNCLMSLLVTINGNLLVPEDFDELSMKDYTELMSSVADENFTSAPAK